MGYRLPHKSRSVKANRLPVWSLVVIAACTAKTDSATTTSTPLPPDAAASVADSGARTPRLEIDSTAPADSAKIPWPWGPYDTLYNKPIDASYRLQIARQPDTIPDRFVLRVRLLSLTRSDLVWDVVTLPSRDYEYRVVRADSTLIVFSRHGDYGQDQSLKIFLDGAGKIPIREIEFSPLTSLDSISDNEVASALGVPESLVKALREREPRPPIEPPWDVHLPRALRDHPMPVSTYPEFARARPERVAGGYGPDDTEISEMPGPVQIDGSRIWFGKTFYDGEGSSGVGDVGYFDTTNSTYGFLKLPELARWSVSTILLEDRVLWIGLVGHPEGADYGGGLVRHDLKTGTTTTIPVEDVILRIKRWNGRTYVATSSGAAVIENDKVVARFMAEPTLASKYVLVRVEPR